jgi:hypothetical protein
MAKCEVCAIPYGETVCVTCGAGSEVVGTINLVYEVGSTALVPGMSSNKVREGVQVEPAPCGLCGRTTVNRIESPDGKVGCLDCLKDFLLDDLLESG